MTFSVLDLAPVGAGEAVGDALRNSVALAKAAEAAGYHRFWLAEHHNMAGVASSATAVMIGQVAAATTSMRVGAGGIMLPNHAPLMVAEAFGTLEGLFPGRIDLGLGRAPGGDLAVMRALRRPGGGADQFDQDVLELMGYLGPAQADAAVRAVPGEGAQVPIWILGSSLYGANLAAQLGLPFAFASHFAPMALETAFAQYRARFRPSAALAAPHAMMVANVCVAPTEEEAAFLNSSKVMSFANLRLGRPSRIPAPVARIEDHVPPAVLREVGAALSVSAVGTAAQVQGQLAALVARYRPDELMVAGLIHDPAARIRSFELAAEVLPDALAQGRAA